MVILRRGSFAVFSAALGIFRLNLLARECNGGSVWEVWDRGDEMMGFLHNIDVQLVILTNKALRRGET